MQGPNFITGFTSYQYGQGYSYKNLVSRVTASNDDSNSNVSERLLDLSWLEAAAPIYKISADPNDYEFGVVRALVADLPNRNGHGFELDELLKFNQEAGKQAYRTFEGKPLLVNHKYDLPKASGVLVASRIIQDGPYCAVELTLGADRNKNKVVAASIKKGDAEFSMGANCTHFHCSICGAEFSLQNPDVHCRPNSILKPNHSHGNMIAYMVVRGITFIENSYLGGGQKPADPRALHTDMTII